MAVIPDIACKGCGGADLCKDGIVHGNQRYLCKSCGMNFTNTPARGKPAAMKDMALAMHAIGGMSFCGIAKILGVSDVAVLNWVRAKAKTLPEVPAPPPSGEASGSGTPVVLDEMWHYVKKSCKTLAMARFRSGWKENYCVDPRQARRRDLPKAPRQGRNECKVFVTDDWEGYHRLIREKQLYTGKDLTFPIEQDNGNIRHCLARFHRRTKVVLKCEEMVAATLKLYHHYHDCPGNLECLLGKTRSIFG